METKQFCLLCAKHKDNLKRIEFGPVQIDVCKDCDKTIFNLNRIISETKKKMLEGLIKTNDKVLIKGIVENDKKEHN